MNTKIRQFIWIIILLALLTLEFQTPGLAQDKKNGSMPHIVALSVKASFDQGDSKLRCSSIWSGKLLCQYDRPKNNGGTLDVSFPVGLGANPSSLNIRWITLSDKKTKSSGPVFISFVKYKTEPSGVMAWTQMKESNDPSLTIALAASKEKEQEYTNEDEVEGKIVAWLRDKKGTICLPLAEVNIPERSILFKFSTDKLGEPLAELTIRSMRIIDFEDDTWEWIIKQGNRHLSLPEDPGDAECKSFTARTEIGQTESQQSTSDLQCAILQAYRAGDIDTSDVKKMVGYMDSYKVSESNTDYSQTVINKIHFSELLNNITKSNRTIPPNTKTILELNKKVFTNTFSSARYPGHRVPPPSHTAAGPEVTYYVRQVFGTYTPDGTSEHPFWSISRAYDAAKAVDSRRVEIIVDGGYYDEQLNLDRNTILTAEPGSRPIIGSTIVCTRALRLEMTGFTLLGAPSPGALQVPVPGSSVYLVDVEISEAHRYGIYQRGGEINLRSVTVHDTRREAGQMEYGSGMVLQDGIRAFLATVTLYENESSGIILRGRDSYLAGLDVTLRRNKLHTDFYSEAAHNIELPIGAFLVNDRATAHLTRLHIHESEFCGLGVYNNAEVTVDNAIINYSRYIHLAEEDLTAEDRGLGRTNDWGGIGIRAKNGGHITMQNFLISHCDLVGVAIHNLGEIDLHEGSVSFNIIGVHVAWSFDVLRLMDLVAYYENESNLQMDGGLPVPGGVPDIPD